MPELTVNKTRHGFTNDEFAQAVQMGQAARKFPPADGALVGLEDGDLDRGAEAVGVELGVATGMTRPAQLDGLGFQCADAMAGQG